MSLLQKCRQLLQACSKQGFVNPQNFTIDNLKRLGCLRIVHPEAFCRSKKRLILFSVDELRILNDELGRNDDLPVRGEEAESLKVAQTFKSRFSIFLRNNIFRLYSQGFIKTFNSFLKLSLNAKSIPFIAPYVAGFGIYL